MEHQADRGEGDHRLGNFGQRLIVLGWPLHEFREWAKNALAAVRDLRRTFSEPGDLMWRARATEMLEAEGLEQIADGRERPAA